MDKWLIWNSRFIQNYSLELEKDLGDPSIEKLLVLQGSHNNAPPLNVQCRVSVTSISLNFDIVGDMFLCIGVTQISAKMDKGGEGSG